MTIVRSSEVKAKPKSAQPDSARAQSDGFITITPQQLEEFGEGIVTRTLVEMGYKASQFQSGRINRVDMIEVLGSRRKFEVAVISGRLRVHKEGANNSRVWASRQDWDKFLRDHTNKKV